MSKSEDNLNIAFAGESQANRKYLAFAEKAESDGHTQAARLFRAAAHAETVHAHNHLRALKGIGSTEENLGEAISGETHEFKEMYPGMIKAAEDEGNNAAKRTFHYANEVEKVHADLYTKVLDGIGTKQEEYPYYVCPVCGFTAEMEAPEKCPICNTPGGKFERFN